MKSTSRIALVGAALICPLAMAWAAPRVRSHKGRTARRAPVRLASVPKPAPVKKPATIDQSKLPQFVSMQTIQRIQKEYRGEPFPALQPFWQGQAIKRPMSNLLTGPALDLPAATKGKKPPVFLAQGFPRPVAPAAVPSGATRGSGGGARPTVPSWVRYPLDFQLCGIGLGTKAVDKDRFNRIDRYGIFALHGNPTAVVRRVLSSTTAGDATGAAGGAPAGGAARGGTPGGADGGASAAPTGANLTLPQTPPSAATLFGPDPNGGLPDWALAVTVELDANQVEWLYKRDTYAMGFVVDRFGYCQAIIVAGIQSPIARVQLEDPVHTIKLGDDLRKVMNRYGYPDDIAVLASDPITSTNGVTGESNGGGLGGGTFTPGGGGGAAAGGAPAPGGAGGTAESINTSFRTFDLRYDQSYNTVFTIRNNRVVRMYIFGDPDFFNAQRRNALRTRY